ncbi:hypothetical protein HUT19_35920 [Streptomyces sp. NA02950]|uniref:hypothetical protein n=1 Tax=Streptomyces sp. NA02950 TaxID=2742137 RepID=UPI001590DB2F|nr:hypothetical protein [Streptomyces sp. NA02950]QKV96435.1 hypothetical protein HUT19_35920 [Streptomyces sp. NA02950]
MDGVGAARLVQRLGEQCTVLGETAVAEARGQPLVERRPRPALRRSPRRGRGR